MATATLTGPRRTLRPRRHLRDRAAAEPMAVGDVAALLRTLPPVPAPARLRRRLLAMADAAPGQTDRRG